jgi:hypothetical protein
MRMSDFSGSRYCRHALKIVANYRAQRGRGAPGRMDKAGAALRRSTRIPSVSRETLPSDVPLSASDTSQRTPASGVGTAADAESNCVMAYFPCETKRMSASGPPKFEFQSHGAASGLVPENQCITAIAPRQGHNAVEPTPH